MQINFVTSPARRQSCQPGGLGRSVNGQLQDRKMWRKMMTRNELHSILLNAFALVAALSVHLPAAAQEAKHKYATMAPLEQYLMNRDAEIALARSAAPDSISRAMQRSW